MNRRAALVSLIAAGTALVLAGCGADPDASLGEPIETGLWAVGGFDGAVSITADSFEAVSDETIARWELDPGDQDLYTAWFTVEVVEGEWTAEAGDVGAFRNVNWVVGTDGDFVAGPDRAVIDFGSPRIDDDECPNDTDTVQEALASTGTTEVCALLLAPGGSTVSEIGYAKAYKERGRRQMGGAKIVSWSVTDPS
ncbi:hypothetical protein [Frigoribacterium sp. PvP032]|uniref:hypothetical protein n=1 Tax=Frigoribacterium sp. PvP032 TaxID=2806589 RepID=UPI001AEB7666|nr:hypothetical protein [Frigoribacterium sp. PvP032]MBP1189038.1 hypothetical protein [Frigoribacterium sp. PvP032]